MSALRPCVGYDPLGDVLCQDICCAAALLAKVRQYDSRCTGKLQCRCRCATLLPRLTFALPICYEGAFCILAIYLPLPAGEGRSEGSKPINSTGRPSPFPSPGAN